MHGKILKSKARLGMTRIEWLVVISIIALLIGILLPALGASRHHTGLHGPGFLELLFTGWYRYPALLADKWQWSWDQSISVFICLVILFGLSHSFLKWFKSKGENKVDVAASWRGRNTFLLIFLLFLTFVMTITGTMIIHQLNWFVRDEAPVIQYIGSAEKMGVEGMRDYIVAYYTELNDPDFWEQGPRATFSHSSMNEALSLFEMLTVKDTQHRNRALIIIPMHAADRKQLGIVTVIRGESKPQYLFEDDINSVYESLVEKVKQFEPLPEVEAKSVSPGH